MQIPEDKPIQVRYSRLTTGIVVILVGVLFLLRNFGVRLPFMEMHNWWALFILLGAMPSLGVAFGRFQKTGRADLIVLHSLLSAAAIILVAAFFLFDLDWGRWWPLFVIYGGLWVLLGGRRRYDTPS